MLLQLITVIFLLSSLFASHVNAGTTPRNAPSLAHTLSDTHDNAPLLMYQQALNYLLGRNGAEKSAKKAAELFKTLAEQNWSSAQHMLGNMYLSGKGVQKNDLLAYKWLSLASRNNLQLAEAIQSKRKLLYKKLQSNLSDQSFSRLESGIAEWSPSNAAPQL
ncbi:hypothetical protein MNBD_GAMMA11-2446 [hydrothermal vent metagenome]|uniref:Sel1 repeat family protein n=1 Tax=hydrothermal vent metagenome TaxID=652676 RepID=A0A3B0X7P5_9ZZZZ